MAHPIDNLTSPKLLRIFGAACCLIWAGGYVGMHVAAQRMVSPEGVQLGKDFLAFYVGGRIVLESRGAELYDPSTQQQVQDATLSPERLGALSYYISPASVAVVYSLFARLPYLTAFHLHTVLMLVFFILSLVILKSHLGEVGRHGVVVGLVSLAWFPVMHTITGGQNAALSLLLWSVAYSAIVAGRQWWAGLALGLLLYKPQYAIPFIGLLLLRKQWGCVMVSMAVGAGHYVLGSLFCGWDWPMKMADTLGSYYRQQERLVSGATHMSIMEVLDYSVIQRLEKARANPEIIQMVSWLGYAMIGMIVLYLIWVWRNAQPRREDFGIYWALASAASLLISLHTQYYEAALLVMPVLLLLSRQVELKIPIRANWRMILAAVYLLTFLVPKISESKWMIFQPSILLPIGVCWWAIRLLNHSRSPLQAGANS